MNADNVGKMVEEVQPFGVDVSSGVESSPGIKNLEAVAKFVGQARKGAEDGSKGF